MPANVIYTLADPDHFESVDAYQPQDDFLGVVRSILPVSWRLHRSGIWFQCAPPRTASPPAQGWKIHVSATISSAAAILPVVTRTCVERQRSFKFAIDRRLLSLMNSKSWDRGGAGKFMTIYPHGTEDFRELIECLHQRLAGQVGPYILSDRRYRDSTVLYYRYGGIAPRRRLRPDGDRAPVILDPDGVEVSDVRSAGFTPPPWEADPFPPDVAATEEPEATLGGGRYTVARPLSFSNTGGVYLATTAAGDEVVIKEARPYTGSTMGGHDAQSLLEKEFRLLTRLDGSGVAPRPVELFRDWEHLFLAEERIPGVTLQRFNASHNLLLPARVTAAARRRNLALLERLWVSLAEAVRTLHRRGVVFGDLSPNNVMITDIESMQVRLIDFEGARELGVDTETGLRTPGFASRARREADPAEDAYALGALMLCSLWPANALLDLAPEAKRRVITTIAADTGLAEPRAELILALLDDDPAARPRPDAVLDVLRRTPQQRARSGARRAGIAEVAAVVDGTRAYTLAVADPRNVDRLFPANPAIFDTNPMGVAHGACGVARSLLRTHGEVPRHLLGWMLRQPLSADAYPPGLHYGLSGIAWAFAELGHADLGAELMAAVRDHPLLLAVPGIARGAAGSGLACLEFWRRTGDRRHLDEAVRIGDVLLQRAAPAGPGLCWPDAENAERRPIGFGEGASGIATFLLYLHAATGDSAPLHAGRRALEFVLSTAQTPPGAGHTTFARDRSGGNILVPYLMEGSAGVGTAVLRYLAVTGDAELRTALDSLLPDVARKYSIYPGLFLGMAGLANLLLDCHDLLGGPRFLRQARRAVDGVLLYRLDRPRGVAFPGEGLTRISTDYASGSAGIALVLHRLLAAQRDGVSGGNFNFMLDDLLSGLIRIPRAAPSP